MHQTLFSCSTNHLFTKKGCRPVIFATFLLLVYTNPAVAWTARTAESMLSRKNQSIGTKTYKGQTTGTNRNTEKLVSDDSEKQRPLKLNTSTTRKSPHNSSPHTFPVKRKHSTNGSYQSTYGGVRHIVNGVKLEIHSCKYVPEYKSVTCDFKATNLEPDIEAVMYCYTGTVAVDEQGNTLQCAHVWLGSNHSWNYAHGKLIKGTPVRGMIRLETKRAPKKLRALKVSMALNGATESALMKNIPVR